MNFVVGGEEVTHVFLLTNLGMGRITKRELLRKSWSLKHFDQLWLRRVGLLVELEVSNSFSSNSSERVPSIEFQDLEHLNRRKCGSSLHGCFTNFHEADSGFKMEHWQFFCFCFWNLLLGSVCFCFHFLFWGLMGKSFWTLSFVNSHCVPVKSLFFHNLVSYIFIKPHHIFFTVKILKSCFQVGQLMKF